ncbi:MAG: hypothetical protein WDM84_10260 [Bauldia sp.]
MFQGLYLNMDRATERRARVEAVLNDAGLAANYRRVAAVDGRSIDPTWASTKAGAVGCFMSHLAALAAAAEFDGITPRHRGRHNRQLPPPLLSRVRYGETRAGEVRHRLSSLWIDYPTLPSFIEKCRETRGEVRLFDAREARISSTDSYVVSRKSAAKLHKLLSSTGPTKPVDNMMQYMTRLGELKAAFTLPFLTCIDPLTGVSSSIVEIASDEYRLLALSRRLVYADSGTVELPSATEVAPALRPTLEYIRTCAGL